MDNRARGGAERPVGSLVDSPKGERVKVFDEEEGSSGVGRVKGQFWENVERSLGCCIRNVDAHF